ncbi:MAG TPA: carbohydrate ABC transporter permease, partial [Lentzea sp.]
TVLRSSSVMPVTPALLALQGQYVSNWNVIAAGSVIAAIPTVAVFLRFQRHFISGLAVGAVK